MKQGRRLPRWVTQGAQRPVSITTRGLLASIGVLLVALACVRLGFWQLDRLRQRRASNTLLQARLAAPPVELGSAPRDSAGWLYRRVLLHGRLDTPHSIILPGLAYRGTPGAHVLTPLLLDNGEAVLVDRGWMPAADGATVDFEHLPDSTLVSTPGIVLRFPGEEPWRRSLPASARVGTPVSGGFRRVWFAMDETALRNQFPYPLGATLVSLLPVPGVTALPVRSPLPALDEGPHLGYAIQWFSFAAIAVIGWLVLVARGSVPRTGPAP